MCQIEEPPLKPYPAHIDLAKLTVNHLPVASYKNANAICAFGDIGRQVDLPLKKCVLQQPQTIL